MKMKSKFFGNGAKLALAVLAVCGTLFTSCYEKAEVDEATKPAPAKYYIAGTITDATTGQVLTTAQLHWVVNLSELHSTKKFPIRQKDIAWKFLQQVIILYQNKYT